MQRAFIAVVLIASSGCLTTVDQRWCDRSRPCSAGFVCTPDFHCILAPRIDGGMGGGTGGGQPTGGGTGGGLPTGGGTGGGLPTGGGTGGGRPTGGGAGGGTPVGGGGGPIGGGVGGGGPIGGGGGTSCNLTNCASGCCVNDRCVPISVQSTALCGRGAERCVACATGLTCVMGACVFPGTDAGPPSSIGSPCQGDTACGTDGVSFCIPENSGGQPTGFVGGYCSRLCDMAPCPGTARCVPAEDGSGGTVNICLASCMTVAECRMGYLCETGFGPGICLP